MSFLLFTRGSAVPSTPHRSVFVAPQPRPVRAARLGGLWRGTDHRAPHGGDSEQSPGVLAHGWHLGLRSAGREFFFFFLTF